MHIRQHGQLKVFNPKPGTPNQEAYTVIQVVVPTAQFTEPGAIADCYRYVGHRVEITLRADPLPPPAHAARPMETLWSANGQDERMRPGPTETCSECGKVIGDDPDADFYAPIAGPSHAVCGDCAVKLDDQQLAEEAEREAADGALIDRGIKKDLAPAEDPYDDPHDQDTITVLVDPETLDIVSVSGPDDEPIGDGPMPERPADIEPVTTPTRRRR